MIPFKPLITLLVLSLATIGRAVGADSPQTGPGPLGESRPAAAPADVPSFPLPTAQETKILKALDVPISVNWDNRPLEEVLEGLEDQCGFEIWIDKRALSDRGINTNLKIVLAVKDVSTRSCLRLTLEPLGLIFAVEDEVLKITTTESQSVRTTTRIYPVGDLFDTADEAKEFLATIECGLGKPEDPDGVPRLAVSSRLKTLTVRDSFTVQEKVKTLIRALRDSQEVSPARKRDVPAGILKN